MRRAPTGLDPRPSDADLKRIAEERMARRGGKSVAPPPPPKPTIPLPLTIRLPWSMLVSDNDKCETKGGRHVLTERYKQAKAAIAARVSDELGAVEPLAVPLELSSRVYVPDNRVHDVCNFAKGVHDALEGVVYTKDRWLKRTTWEEAGVDVDAPRAEITIRYRVAA